MAITAKPINGIPLIAVPSIFDLEGDFGKEVLAEYQGRARDLGNVSVLNVLSSRGNKIIGSNPYSVALINRVIEGAGYGVASQSDYEKAIKLGNGERFKGTYSDTSLVLRTRGNPNSYLAENLMEQIRARDPKAEMPTMIPLTEVYLVKDQNSNTGLAFKLKDDAEFYTQQTVLNPLEGCDSFDSIDVDLRTGLPTKFSTNVKRRLFTRKDGLSRLYLDEDLDFISSSGDFSFSNANGRVRVIPI